MQSTKGLLLPLGTACSDLSLECTVLRFWWVKFCLNCVSSMDSFHPEDRNQGEPSPRDSSLLGLPAQLAQAARPQGQTISIPPSCFVQFCLFSPGAECGHPSFILVWKRSGNKKSGHRRRDPPGQSKLYKETLVSKNLKGGGGGGKKRGPKEKAIQRLQRELSWWQRFRVKSTTSCFWWGQPTYAGHFQHSSPVPKLCCWQLVPGAHKCLSRLELAWEILKAQRVSILISLCSKAHALGANLPIRPSKAHTPVF